MEFGKGTNGDVEMIKGRKMGSKRHWVYAYRLTGEAGISVLIENRRNELKLSGTVQVDGRKTFPTAQRGPGLRFGNENRRWTREHSEEKGTISSPNIFYLDGH